MLVAHKADDVGGHRADDALARQILQMAQRQQYLWVGINKLVVVMIVSNCDLVQRCVSWEQTYRVVTIRMRCIKSALLITQVATSRRD